MGDNFEFNLGDHMQDVFEVNFWENFFGNCRDNHADNFGNKLSGSHHVMRQYCKVYGTESLFLVKRMWLKL